MNLKPVVAVLGLVLASISPVAFGADEKPLVHEGIVAAPVEDVWKAFTTKAGQESWMVSQSEIDLKVGGLMRTHYDLKGTIGDAKTIENTILSFEPQRMFSIKVSKAPDTFPFPTAIKKMWTIVYFEVESSKATKVRIVGLGFGDDDESKKMRQFFDSGNAYTLKKLQEKFASKKLDR